MQMSAHASGNVNDVSQSSQIIVGAACKERPSSAMEGAEDGSDQKLWSEDWPELFRWISPGRAWSVVEEVGVGRAGAGGGERAAEKSRSYVFSGSSCISTVTKSVAFQDC